MRKLLLTLFTLTATVLTANAIDNNTVEVAFSGNSATVSIADNISSYITNISDGSHVRLIQSATFAGNATGEITYILSGTSTDGEFYLDGSYKCTVQLNALTLTNPQGPALNIQNGKRVKVNMASGTTSTLTDGANADYNGCLHCKGHTEFRGKGTLNISGNSKHAIYSKEYIEVKNCTINVTSALKDAIHCKEYFLMESGVINITGATDDGIQVELDGTTSTGVTTDHEDEDTGNFYMTDGTLSISGYGSQAVKADGTVNISGGTQNFPAGDVVENALGISDIQLSALGSTAYYDLQGRTLTSPKKGLNIVRVNGKSAVVLNTQR